MVIKQRKKIIKKSVPVLTILSLISLLIINANPVSACYYKIGTFEDDYSTSKDSFFKGEIVYGKGETYGYNYLLKIRIRDPDDNVVYYSNESKNVVYGSFFLNDSAKVGTWSIQLGIKKCSWKWSTEYGKIAYFSVGDTNFSLTVNVSGNGSVFKDPDETNYSYGTIVKLTAVPDLGWSFVNWSGDLISSTNPVNITIDSDKTVTATFNQDQYLLDIIIEGNGSVAKYPDQETYLYGTLVNLMAIADTGCTFCNWSGNLSCTNCSMSIVMDSNKSVVALFTEELYILDIVVDGNGYVSRVPDKEFYNYGDIVNLTAIPSEGSTFDHWSGNLSGNSNPMTINMTENKNVTAHFIISSNNGGDDGNGDNGGSNSGGGGVISSSHKKPNEAPIADLSAGELYKGFVNEEIDFNGTLSYDKDGYITKWFWNFGDGTTALGEITIHSYSSPGTYNVILIVTDDKGARDSDTTSAVIILPNHPPAQPNINGPTEGFVDIEYLFSIVSTDEDNDEIKYTIDWGDGNIDESNFLQSGDFFNISHRWTEAGDYLVNVSANDDDTITKIDFIITIDEPDIPEESNIVLFLILLIGLLLLLLFLILLKPQKEKKKEENKKSK